MSLRTSVGTPSQKTLEMFWKEQSITNYQFDGHATGSSMTIVNSKDDLRNWLVFTKWNQSEGKQTCIKFALWFALKYTGKGDSPSPHNIDW